MRLNEWWVRCPRLGCSHVGRYRACLSTGDYADERLCRRCVTDLAAALNRKGFECVVLDTRTCAVFVVALDHDVN